MQYKSKIFYNKCSKCQPCTVEQDAAVLIPWYWKWSYRGNRATWDTRFYDNSSLFRSTERVSKIWLPISETSCIYWLPAGLNGPQTPCVRHFSFSIRCLLVIIHNAKSSHELRLGSTDSTAILFETWIKPIIIWRRQYSSVDLSTSMLLPMFFDPFHFLNGAQNVDCRMACHSGATPLGPPFYQELVNNTEIQIPS